MKLSLGMIFKDEVNQFKRIVDAYGSLFDEIVIAVDERISDFKEVADSYPSLNIKILPYTWCNDFSHKRNFVQYHITGDMYMRIDADDAIHPGTANKLRSIAEKAVEDDISVVFGYYNYSRDEWGNVNAGHWRDFLIKNTSNLYWNKKIHENILPKNTEIYNIDMCQDLIVDHLADSEKINSSLMRNIKYLLEEYNQDKENTDSRTLAYLGRMLHGAGAFDKSIYFLEKHIHTSGWDEDRYMSWCQMSDCYRQLGKNEQAISCAFEALQERPDYPDAYLKLHDAYFAIEDWEKAELWGRQGLLKPIPKTFVIQDISSYQWRPVLSMSYCLFKLGKFEDALKLFNLAKKDVPTIDFIVQHQKMYEMAVEHRKFMQDFLSVFNYLKDRKEDDKIIDLLKSVPKGYEENEIIFKLRHHYNPPNKWSDNSICIFALTDLDDWSPKSVDKGIGGSEEAVIYQSKELAKLGYDVTVFNNCGEQHGDYDGVHYRNAIEFNPKDHFNILISWRTNIFNRGIMAKKRIIWLHDIPQLDMNDDGWKQVDHVIVLSKYHASLLPYNVPKEKIFVSSNGINDSDFLGLDNVHRETHRMIYASSYNRGLEQLLEMWPDILKEVPDATLHIYYGWETYDTFVKQGFVKDTGFKDRMLKLMDQPGVTDHGRVGHKELLREYAKSEILAYPCTYAGEINCIALTKAIACGCIAVTNDHEIMKERNVYGSIHIEQFKEYLINTLKNGYPKIDTKKYIEENSWASIASDWKNRLFGFKYPIAIKDRLDWIIDQIEDKKSKIVDIGCNKGHLFSGWDRTNITSVDIDKYDLQNFICADATKPLPFKDKEFDIAVMGEILEHTHNPVDVVREAMRVSKKLIITVPWEARWPSNLLPFATVEQRMVVDKVDSRLALAKIANPAKEFHTEDNLDHLWHKQFFTIETIQDCLKSADIVDYKIVEIRDSKQEEFVNIGVICG